MAEEYDLDDWSSKSHGRQAYEKKTFFEQWKNRPGHKANIFLHTKAKTALVYRHGFWRVSDVEDKDTKVKTRRVFYTTLNCHEDTATSQKQYKRDADGDRIMPPKFCPHCLTAEYLRSEVVAGRLRETDTAFEFKGKDNKGNDTVRRILVGAMYGAFSGDKTEDEKAVLRAAGLEPKDAWKEDNTATGNTVLRIVDADNPEKGIQIAMEKTSVGDAIRKVIRDTKESKGDEAGNPILNPYCIQLDFDKNEMMSKMYSARMIERIKPTAEILKLIRDTEPPTLGPVIEPFDPEYWRPIFEKACVLKNVPWDRLFATAKKVERKEEPKPAPSYNTTGAYDPRKVASPQKPAPAEVLYECDNVEPGTCTNTAMKATDAKCGVCGKVYIEETPAPPPPPPPPRAKRGAAQAAPPPPPVASPGEDRGDDTGDEIPF